jgi:AraC-like DNA-binding protein
MKAEIEDLFIRPEDIRGEDIFMSEDVSINRALRFPAGGTVSVNHPYRIPDTRIIHVLSGSLTYLVNLRTFQLGPDDVIVIPEGSIIEICSMSDDLLISGILTRLANPGKVIYVSPGAEKQEITALLDALWKAVWHSPLRKEYVTKLLEALLADLEALADVREDSHPPSRQGRLSRQFIDLLPLHCKSHRDIPFYASELCISPHYLSAVIKSETGQSAGDWIERAVIQEARFQLHYSDKTVLQISEELGFPNPAFFTKYFKRLTGLTPRQYRTHFPTDTQAKTPPERFRRG